MQQACATTAATTRSARGSGSRRLKKQGVNAQQLVVLEVVGVYRILSRDVDISQIVVNESTLRHHK